MATFGERLKATRNAKNITLDRMAEDLQTTKATLSRYENGLREPKADFTKKIAEYFNVSIDYLLGRTEIQNIYTDNLLSNSNNSNLPEINADKGNIKKDVSIFGERLRQLLDETGVEGKIFAKLMHVEPPTVSNWLTGTRFPKEDILVNIANYFDVTLDWLMGRASDKNLKIYEANVDGDHYKISVNKSYPHDLTPEEVDNFIKQLQDVGFDVNKLIEKAKNQK